MTVLMLLLVGEWEMLVSMMIIFLRSLFVFLKVGYKGLLARLVSVSELSEPVTTLSASEKAGLFEIEEPPSV